MPNRQRQSGGGLCTRANRIQGSIYRQVALTCHRTIHRGASRNSALIRSRIQEDQDYGAADGYNTPASNPDPVLAYYIDPFHANPSHVRTGLNISEYITEADLTWDIRVQFGNKVNF